MIYENQVECILSQTKSLDALAWVG